MKDFKKIKGATTISKKDQKNIKGGWHNCDTDADCERPDVSSYSCVMGRCMYSV